MSSAESAAAAEPTPKAPAARVVKVSSLSWRTAPDVCGGGALHDGAERAVRSNRIERQIGCQRLQRTRALGGQVRHRRYYTRFSEEIMSTGAPISRAGKRRSRIATERR